jgi:hypothetical protein
MLKIPSSLDRLVLSMQYLSIENKRKLFELFTVAFLLADKSCLDTARDTINTLVFHKELLRELVEELDVGHDLQFKVYNSA